jgi:hypothetical protein
MLKFSLNIYKQMALTLRSNKMKAFIISLFSLFLSHFVFAESLPEIEVHRSPDCHCCHKWITHLEEQQFIVIDKPNYDMANVKSHVGLPKAMASCHTAIIDGYVIEGHVPAADIKHLLETKPDIAGLSVPRMPIGTPGMEMGPRKDEFIVFQFGHGGRYTPFSEYRLDENNTYQHELTH